MSTPAILRKLQRTARSASNEAAAFERLAVVTIHDAKPASAAKICAALAARTAGLSAQHANGGSGPIDAAELFTAWLETARAMIAARGRARPSQIIADRKALGAQERGARGLRPSRSPPPCAESLRELLRNCRLSARSIWLPRSKSVN